MKDRKNIVEDGFELELGDKLRGFREEPPAGMFERIEESLAAAATAAAPEASTTVKTPSATTATTPLWSRLWFRGVAATAAAAVVAFAIVLGLRSDQLIVGGQFGGLVCDGGLTLSAPTAMVREPNLPLVKVARAGRDDSSIAQYKGEVTSRMALVEPTEEQMGEAESQKSNLNSGDSSSEENQSEAVITTTATRRSRRERSKRSRDNSSVEEYWRSVIAKEPSQSRGFRPTELGVYMAGMGVNHGNVRKDNLAHSQMLVVEQNNMGGQGLLGPMMASRNNSTKLEHSVPVTIGLTASCPLTDWLSLESGLLFTRLSSQSESSGIISSYELRRNMDYLGVPLAFTIDMVDFGRVGLYGRIGVTGELLFSATDRFYLDGRFSRAEEITDVQSVVTMSIDAAAGVNVGLFSNVGLFGEVGCSYWNAPDNYPDNYRTVHPLSIALRFGIKYTFN